MGKWTERQEERARRAASKSYQTPIAASYRRGFWHGVGSQLALALVLAMVFRSLTQ